MAQRLVSVFVDRATRLVYSSSYKQEPTTLQRLIGPTVNDEVLTRLVIGEWTGPGVFQAVDYSDEEIRWTWGRRSRRPSLGVCSIAYKGTEAVGAISFELGDEAFAATIEAALNAIPEMITDGGVNVSVQDGSFMVQGRSAADLGEITFPEVEAIPGATVDVTTLAQGSGLDRESISLTFRESPAVVVESWLDTGIAPADIRIDKSGTTTQAHTFSILFDPLVKEGTMSLQLGTAW